jgi:hypothetical protein
MKLRPEIWDASLNGSHKAAFYSKAAANPKVTFSRSIPRTIIQIPLAAFLLFLAVAAAYLSISPLSVARRGSVLRRQNLLKALIDLLNQGPGPFNASQRMVADRSGSADEGRNDLLDFIASKLSLKVSLEKNH